MYLFYVQQRVSRHESQTNLILIVSFFVNKNRNNPGNSIKCHLSEFFFLFFYLLFFCLLFFVWFYWYTLSCLLIQYKLFCVTICFFFLRPFNLLMFSSSFFNHFNVYSFSYLFLRDCYVHLVFESFIDYPQFIAIVFLSY